MAKKPSVENVRIVRIPKTSHAEAGIHKLGEHMKEGDTIAVFGGAYWPDHDRELHEGIIYPALEVLKPDWVVLGGNMLHDDAWNEAAPRRLQERARVAVHHHAPGPELAHALSLAGWENRVAALFASANEYITSFAVPGNSRVLYIPSASQLMPRETELMLHLYRLMEYLDGFRERTKSPDPPGTIAERVREILRGNQRHSSNDFAQLLNITDPRVQVAPFGAAATIGELKLEIGDFRRRNPGTSAHTEMHRRGRSIIKTFDGKTASGWVTMPGSALPNRRRSFQFHEVGHIHDTRRMGYLRDYDFWSQGLFYGMMVRGRVHGQTYTFQRDPEGDGCRSIVIDGHPFRECSAGGLARVNPITASFEKPAATEATASDVSAAAAVEPLTGADIDALVERVVLSARPRRVRKSLKKPNVPAKKKKKRTPRRKK
jgi:hypothetical protein